MVSRLGIAWLVCLFAAAWASGQEVVRFETSLGEFDMVLNPTNNPLLQLHADNMLQYIEDNRYSRSWINRADEGFVLQMGGFYSHTRRPPPTIDSTRGLVPFDSVPGEPAEEIEGLSNTVGTVSLALPGDGMGGTDQDAGTSSFFINLASNTFLDANFTVFAAIPDMTVINQIMALMQVDRTTDPDFGAGPGNLGFTDVPLLDNGHQVFINRAFVLQDPLAIARARAGVGATMATSAAGAENSSTASLLSNAVVVPEPATFVAFLSGLCGLVAARVRRRRVDV